MAENCGLVDLTPFSKFDIAGPDALAALQWLCAGDCDLAVGGTQYTPLLNQAGGIIEDATVTRFAPDQLRLTTGAATRWKTRGWMTAALGDYDAVLTDRTEDESVIGVMGPQSRAILSSLSDKDWSDFPFATSRVVTVAGQSIRATRLSFVGELGWELNIQNKSAPAVFAALIAAGAKPVGHYTLDGCRLEKGYKHWGHDLGPLGTPLEAGLGFTIGWSKPDFLGKAALVAQKKSGITRRLVLLEIEGVPLMLHDEPVWEGDRIIGLTTSGGVGPRTGLTLAFADIEIGKGETLAATSLRALRVEVAGAFYSAKPLTKPPYDPTNERMRA